MSNDDNPSEILFKPKVLNSILISYVIANLFFMVLTICAAHENFLSLQCYLQLGLLAFIPYFFSDPVRIIDVVVILVLFGMVVGPIYAVSRANAHGCIDIFVMTCCFMLWFLCALAVACVGV